MRTNTLGNADWASALFQAGADAYGTYQDGKNYQRSINAEMEGQASILAMEQIKSQQLKTIAMVVGGVTVAAIVGVIIYKLAS